MSRMLLAVLCCHVVLAGCVPKSRMAPVAASQIDAAQRLLVAHETDQTVLVRCVDTLLAVERAALLREIELSLFEREYLDAQDQPDPARLENDLSDPNLENVLLTDIRNGRLSLAQATSFLHDCSLALRMSDADSRLADLFSSLSLVRQFDVSADAIRRALDQHRTETRRLHAELLEVAQATWRYATFSPDPHAATPLLLSRLWQMHVLERIDDPEKRQSAADLLDLILQTTH